MTWDTLEVRPGLHLMALAMAARGGDRVWANQPTMSTVENGNPTCGLLIRIGARRLVEYLLLPAHNAPARGGDSLDIDDTFRCCTRRAAKLTFSWKRLPMGGARLTPPNPCVRRPAAGRAVAFVLRGPAGTRHPAREIRGHGPPASFGASAANWPRHPRITFCAAMGTMPARAFIGLVRGTGFIDYIFGLRGNSRSEKGNRV